MRVTISPLAERDLKAVSGYIADDKPARAVTFVAELRDQCALIAETPQACRSRLELGEHPLLRSRQLRDLLHHHESQADDCACSAWSDRYSGAIRRQAGLINPAGFAHV